MAAQVSEMVTLLKIVAFEVASVIHPAGYLSSGGTYSRATGK